MKNLILLIFCSVSLIAKDIDSTFILKDKLEISDKRYPTFDYALNLLNQKIDPVIVETGTARFGRQNCQGDGCSTIIFAEWIRSHSGVFYSVDIDPKSLEQAKQGLEDLFPYATLICQDSVNFLHTFTQTIDFLYLDSYDFNINNPRPSQIHHLKEIQAAYSHLAPDCIVMIDDCDLPHGGKGKDAIQFLLSRGWKISAKGYQVILQRGS